ncbi:50S ribosomal protein L33 [Streptomyces sp. NPDC050400]|uniref:50S ribosomal protein L33 n=1 Tax=Streptomyces sp. NPDC050400 TaxID=3365610 RepID=UPI003799BB5B
MTRTELRPIAEPRSAVGASGSYVTRMNGRIDPDRRTPHPYERLGGHAFPSRSTGAVGRGERHYGRGRSGR